MEKYHKLMEKMKIIDLLKREYCAHYASQVRVTRGQFPILKTLSKHDGCTQVELARFLHLSTAAITKALQRLLKTGYIIKEKDESNGRIYRLHLTKLGKESLNQAEIRFDQFDERLFQNISEEKLKEFEEILNQMIFQITGSNSVSLQTLCDNICKVEGRD